MDELVQSLLHTLLPKQAQLAQDLEVSRSSLYSWLVGRRYPSRQSIVRLAAVAESRARQIERLAQELRSALGSEGGAAR